jgi:hypothetical protein
MDNATFDPDASVAAAAAARAAQMVLRELSELPATEALAATAIAFGEVASFTASRTTRGAIEPRPFRAVATARNPRM